MLWNMIPQDQMEANLPISVTALNEYEIMFIYVLIKSNIPPHSLITLPKNHEQNKIRAFI